MWILGLWVVAWALSACSSSSNNPSGGGAGGGVGTYAAKCAVACAPPTHGPCASGQDIDACQYRCEVLTEGLSTSCAQCMIENSAWEGADCSCYGSGCCLEYFGFEATNPICQPTQSCEAADEACTGFELAPSTGHYCRASCGADAG